MHYFKLSAYDSALSDYQAALGGMDLQCKEVSSNLQRRIHICKLKQRSCLSTPTLDKHAMNGKVKVDESTCGMHSFEEMSSFEDLVAEFKSEGGLDPRK